jgi:hypothetical protein
MGNKKLIEKLKTKNLMDDKNFYCIVTDRSMYKNIFLFGGMIAASIKSIITVTNRYILCLNGNSVNLIMFKSVKKICHINTYDITNFKVFETKKIFFGVELNYVIMSDNIFMDFYCSNGKSIKMFFKEVENRATLQQVLPSVGEKPACQTEQAKTAEQQAEKEETAASDK